jgi:hypothetical protein
MVSAFLSQSSSLCLDVCLLLCDRKSKYISLGKSSLLCTPKGGKDTYMLSASLWKNISTSVLFFFSNPQIYDFWPAKILQQPQYVFLFLLSQNRHCKDKHSSTNTITTWAQGTPTWRIYKVCPLFQNLRVKVPCLSFSYLKTRQIYIWACQKARDSHPCLRLALKFIQLHPMLSFFS